MQEQFKIITNVKSQLKGEYLVKLKKSLSKNPDLESFTSKKDLGHRLKTSCAPLTSAEVERSFSKYKNFMTENRLRFKDDNVEKYIFIQCNSNL